MRTNEANEHFTWKSVGVTAESKRLNMKTPLVMQTIALKLLYMRCKELVRRSYGPASLEVLEVSRGQSAKVGSNGSCGGRTRRPR